MKTFAMMILGCKVNDYEATFVREKMRDHFTEVSFKEKADIYVIFTCCVTNTAEAKTRKFIHHARRMNEEAFVVAVGCLMQIKGKTKEFADVDLVIGSQEKDKIVDYILAHEKKNAVKDEIDPQFENLFLNSYPGKSRAFLKIEDGCNQFCAYCIIPYARGRERSGKHEEILRQAKILSASCKELVLTGIHTGRYNDNGYHLIDLLRDLLKIDEIETIRLSSIEMNEVTDEIVDLMASTDRLAHHLHIPVQTSSDEILQLMNRPYTVDEYIQRIETIRKKIPDISISTDFIVGFPGESDEIFEKALVNLKKIRFSFIHCFPYSQKKGTKADEMKGHLPASAKKERLKRVMELERGITEEFVSSFLNRKVKVLIEKCENGYSYGYAKQYFYVKIPGELPVGDVYPIRIIDTKNEIKGELCD